MFYSLRGILIHTEPGVAVIECGGVGYKCFTSINTQMNIKHGSETTLYTHLCVREDAMELYGFASTSELSCFKLLIGVSGVGPKVAVAILSELTPEQVALSLAAGDSRTFTRASGVGNKLAQRIVLELKDKLKSFGKADVFVPEQGAVIMAGGGNLSAAVEAFAVLGYSAADVTPVLSSLDLSLPVEQLIALTLKQIGSSR